MTETESKVKLTSALPVAWRWQDGDLVWRATASEEEAHHAARVHGYEILDCFDRPAQDDAALKAAVASLKAALKPFAIAAGVLIPADSDDGLVFSVNAGDLRRARLALQGDKP